MDPQLELLLTVGGAGTVITIITEIIIRAAGWTSATKDRFGPVLAVVIGIVVVELATVSIGFVGSRDLVQGLFTGLIAGATAMGIHDFTTGPVQAAVNPD